MGETFPRGLLPRFGMHVTEHVEPASRSSTDCRVYLYRRVWKGLRSGSVLRAKVYSESSGGKRHGAIKGKRRLGGAPAFDRLVPHVGATSQLPPPPYFASLLLLARCSNAQLPEPQHTPAHRSLRAHSPRRRRASRTAQSSTAHQATQSPFSRCSPTQTCRRLRRPVSMFAFSTRR